MDHGDSFVATNIEHLFSASDYTNSGLSANLDGVELIHYSNYDLSNRQVMKHIYTEANYQSIEQLIHDRIIPKKINRKVKLHKKVIHLV